MPKDPNDETRFDIFVHQDQVDKFRAMEPQAQSELVVGNLLGIQSELKKGTKRFDSQDKKIEEHHERICKNEKHRRAVRIAVVVFLALGGFGFLAGAAWAAKIIFVGN
jgi:hypothetical protein